MYSSPSLNFFQSFVMGYLINLLRQVKNQVGNPQVNQEKKQLIPLLVITLVVTGIIGGIREFGWMQFFELAVWDSMVRLSPDRGEDERLLIVEINEQDIQTQKQWPLADETIAQVLTNLQQHNPNVIGLDLYRDVVHKPGHEALVTALAADNVIAIENLINGVPAPPAVPPDRIGFNDFVVDQDNVVRRNFMYTEIKDPAKIYYSFALRLTLAALDLGEEAVVADDIALQVNGQSLPILTPNAGSYHLDEGETVGWQILINYRSANHVAPVVSITDILNNRVNPALIEGKTIWWVPPPLVRKICSLPPTARPTVARFRCPG
ncbi:MAG: CHASE2 domain-containing protein [Synechococcaceae cyanobacterium RL_1_2]|nr:CHASE2 domain-containing protein [Synechococcaceae cyanobacterium RL_1_2]